ncbi:MAG TPA: peptidylprolyl isomerase [Opitutaceae bacterium]|nr:peptidylprolyl isomerase [Opitutaceae bacterium]
MMSRRFVFGAILALSPLVVRAASDLATQPSASAVTAAPVPGTQDVANGIVAIVEGKPITVDDVRREIQPLIPQLQREARNEQEYYQKLEALKEDTIQNLIDRELIVKEFYKKKEGEDEVRHVPASYVDNSIAERLAEQFDGDRSKFLAYLRARGITQRDYRREVEEDIIYSYMNSQQRKSQSIVSPVKIEQFYNENKDRFYQDDAVEMRMVQFTRAEGETDAQLLAKAQEMLSRFKAGEKFEDLAKQYSQDSRRTRGGDWGWQKRTDLKKEFSDPLFALKKGEATSPVVLPEGCFVLYAQDRKYAGIQSLDEVRPEIESILIQQMTHLSKEKWLERLRRNGYVSRRPDY